MSDEIRQAIQELMEKNSGKGKKKAYPKDVVKGLSDSYNRKEVKQEIQNMLNDGSLSYWSSGSTTYVMLPKDFEELSHKEEGTE